MTDLHWLLAERLVQFLRRMARQISKAIPPFAEKPHALPFPFDVLRAEVQKQRPRESIPPASESTRMVRGDEDRELLRQMQGLVSMFRSLLIAFANALAPSKLAGTAATDVDVSAKPTNCATLLYAFLRSEETLEALRELHGLCEQAVDFLRWKETKEGIAYQETYASQLQCYEAYLAARHGGAAMEERRMQELLGSFPPAIEEITELPSISLSPVNTATRALAEALAPVVPCARFLLDICELALETVPEGNEINVDDTLRGLTQKLNEDVGKASPATAVLLQRMSLFEKIMMPPRAAFSYAESQRSSDYFLPVLWKTIHHGVVGSFHQGAS